MEECYKALNDQLDWNNLEEEAPADQTKAAKYYLQGIEDMEIEVQRSDQQLYKFMEDDFLRLYLNDIEDMLLLVIQNILFNLKGEDIVHLAAALHKLEDMLNNLEMRYTSVMPRRRWSNLDKKRSRIMVKDINHQLLEIRKVKIKGEKKEALLTLRQKKSVVEKPIVETNEHKTARKENRALIIEDWVSESEEQDEPKSGPISVNTVRPVNTVQPRTAVNNAGPMKNVNIVKGTRVNTARPKVVLSAVKGDKGNVVKACWVWIPKHKILDHGNPLQDLKDKGVIDSGCSRHITGNISYLTDYEKINGGFELKFNLFSVSQMCEKKNSVPFTDTECVVLSPYFKLTDESHVLLKVPRKDNMYIVDLKNVVHQGGLTCLFAKATTDESNLWIGAGHVNFINNEVNWVLVIKPHNKTPYELFLGRKHALSFMRAFGCPVTILNIIDHLGKFDGKADEGFFVGYSTNSKAFRVFNSRTRIVEENLHVQFSKNTSNIAGSRPNWLFDIDALTNFMNYKLVVAGNRSNGKCRLQKACAVADAGEEEKKDVEDPGNEGGNPSEEGERINQEKDASVNITNNINTVSPTVNAASIEDNTVDENIVYGCADDPNIPDLEKIGRFSDAENDDSGADINNLDTYFQYSNKTDDKEVGGISKEPKKVVQALKDPSWIEAMQEELLQFKLQEVWTLVELPNGKRAIGTKWVFRNKKDERGIVIKNKARLVFLAYASFKDFMVYQMDVKSAFIYGKIEEEVYVCQPPGFEDPDFPDRVYKVERALCGLHQAPRAWYEILLTYLLDNGFQRGKIDKTLFIGRGKCDILIVQVYVDDIIFGSTKKSLCTEFEKMMHKKFQMSSMGELTFFLGLQVKQKEDGIFISQDKYVTEILKKFGFSDVKTASTPMETHKPLLKDTEGEDIDEHMYRSMIGSLMYLTSSRPYIMFVVCVCVRFQVNPKVSHLHAVKRIFRYLKGQPKLGLWYLKDSPFDLVAY
ncbi:putative ribonuclease H-like domain-containing protein [Tanacetum coccineum]